MKLQISNEFRNICQEIVSEKKTPEEWAEIESDDMFQSQMFCGGFDADEMEFCFSYYSPEGREFWFQLAPSDVHAVADGKIHHLELRPAGLSSA